MDKEIWKDVVGYKGEYEVSNHGHVRSVDRVVAYPNNGGYDRPFKGRVLTLRPHRNGYRQVVLSRRGKFTYPLVHRLVAIAFIPNPNGKPQVNHIDGLKANNRVENLEWVTKSENCQHAHDTGLSRSPGLKGSESGRAILNEQTVITIRKLYERGDHSYTSLGNEFGVSKPTIAGIIKRRSWRHI